MSKITYKISKFMTLDEFKKYIDEKVIPKIQEKESEELEKDKKYFILQIERSGNINLISCYISSFKDNDIEFTTVDSFYDSVPDKYYVSAMLEKMSKMKEPPYYIGLGENEKVIGLN